MRQRSSRSVVLTEGEPDTELYRKFVDEGACLVQHVGDRDGVESLLARFDGMRIPAVGGIIDADDDHFMERTSPRPNLFRTDETDRETTLIDSPAFDAFCLAFNSTVPSGELRRRLYAAAYPLGAVRRASHRERWEVSFANIEHGQYIDAGPTCDRQKCCAETVGKNQSVLSEASFHEAITDPQCTTATVTHIVSGHDLTEILSLRSMELFGQQMTARRIDYELNARYSAAEFHRTVTYVSMLAWEIAIKPRYRLF